MTLHPDALRWAKAFLWQPPSAKQPTEEAIRTKAEQLQSEWNARAAEKAKVEQVELLDRFAMAAMNALMMREDLDLRVTEQSISGTAYRFANAMMTERLRWMEKSK